MYLLAGNAGELVVMLAASLVGLPLPLLPLQLLWINLVTDGLPALALVMDPARSELLSRPPRRPDEPMLGRPQWRHILLVGSLEAAVVLGVFVWADPGQQLERARAWPSRRWCSRSCCARSRRAAPRDCSGRWGR